MEQQSHHAARRRAQRSVPSDHIELAFSWGQVIHQPDGREAIHLGRLEAAHARKAGVAVPDRAIGVTVIVGQDGGMVTAIRSGDRHRLLRFGQRRGRGQR